MNSFGVDERRARRKPVEVLSAVAVEGAHLFTCKMVDFTEAGARLQTGEQEAPDRFQLIDIAAGVAYSARVVWRRPGELGAAFLHARPIEDGSAPEWIVELWRKLRTEAGPAGESAKASAA